MIRKERNRLVSLILSRFNVPSYRLGDRIDEWKSKFHVQVTFNRTIKNNFVLRISSVVREVTESLESLTYLAVGQESALKSVRCTKVLNLKIWDSSLKNSSKAGG